jgi:hypothetical protein
MISTKLTVCGQTIIRDVDSNNISVVNIYEGFTAQGFPLLLPGFSFLVVVERQAGDARNHAGRFDIRLGDTVLASSNMNVDFQGQSRTRQIIRIAGLVITAPGIVASRFYIGDQMLGEYKFEVEQGAAPVAEVTSGPVGNQPAQENH